MKLVVLACVKRLFLSGIFTEFFVSVHYDFKLSTKRGMARLYLAMLKWIDSEQHVEVRGAKKEMGLWNSCEDSLALIQILLWLILVFFPPIFFPSTSPSGHLSNFRFKGQQANNLKFRRNRRRKCVWVEQKHEYTPVVTLTMVYTVQFWNRCSLLGVRNISKVSWENTIENNDDNLYDKNPCSCKWKSRGMTPDLTTL